MVRGTACIFLMKAFKLDIPFNTHSWRKQITHVWSETRKRQTRTDTHHFLRILEIEIVSGKNQNNKTYTRAHTRIIISQNVLKLVSWLSKEPRALLFLKLGVAIKRQHAHIIIISESLIDEDKHTRIVDTF